MNLSRILRLARHPVASGARLLERISLARPLPRGRVASMRKLLREAVDDPGRALVIGHPGAVRQAWPTARLDVVGTAPDDAVVTVVSEAMGPGSLPRRWNCVVVTESSSRPERLRAAVDACLPSGVLAVLAPSSGWPELPQQAQVHRTLRSGSVQLVVARVPA